MSVEYHLAMELLRREQIPCQKYRKKPVVIEAFQMTLEANEKKETWPKWLLEASQIFPGNKNCLYMAREAKDYSDDIKKAFWTIQTLEGLHYVNWDDYIIKGVEGELYPCKPWIFEKTYEEVEE